MTVAPKIPIATNKAPGGRLGRNPGQGPEIGPGHDDLDQEQAPMVATSARMNASILPHPQPLRWPAAGRYRTR